MKDKQKTTAIVLAAGRGKRMQSNIQKQYLLIHDKPVIFYALQAFEQSAVDEVILVAGADEVDYCRDEIVYKYGFQKVTKVVAGGAERYDSVYCGLSAASDCDYVLIHDGARPFVTPELINANIECVKKENACVTAVLSKDTVKIGNQDGSIESTPNRANVWIIQTPQSFEYHLLKQAYEKRKAANDEKVTDDAMVVEKYMQRKIKLLQGDYRNIKITTPEDLIIAQALVDDKNDTTIFSCLQIV
jgi:2-C-methyl-D-erythritol 4-phosphate cytidylyltransferase